MNAKMASDGRYGIRRNHAHVMAPKAPFSLFTAGFSAATGSSRGKCFQAWLIAATGLP